MLGDEAALTVRRIRADEALQLREIRLAALAEAPEAFTTTHAEMVDQPVAFWAERVGINSQGEEAATFIAEGSPAWVGPGRGGPGWIGMVAGFHPVPGDPEVELVAMWVAPDGRDMGVGAALVEAVVDWAVSIGAPRVGLWVVRGNEPAIGLYERCGFVETPEFVARPGDPCGGEIRMTRML